jgi:hypothetical protein
MGWRQLFSIRCSETKHTQREQKGHTRRRKREGYAADEKPYDTKILTMGILTANSIHSLGHLEFLGVFLEKQALGKET